MPKAWARARRSKYCKLATNPRLRQPVAGKLSLWKPGESGNRATCSWTCSSPWANLLKALDDTLPTYRKWTYSVGYLSKQGECPMNAHLRPVRSCNVNRKVDPVLRRPANAKLRTREYLTPATGRSVVGSRVVCPIRFYHGLWLKKVSQRRNPRARAAQLTRFCTEKSAHEFSAMAEVPK